MREVTEGIFVGDGARPMRALSELKALAARLSLDEVGTGDCSVSSLQRFPVDLVKIDQGLSVGADGDPLAGAISQPGG